MVVVVERDVVRLDDPDDFQGFKVVVEEGTENQVMQALAQVGSMADRETAWIRADAVRAMAAGRVAEGWESGFAAMLDYATTKGWLRDDGAGGSGAANPSIQAHIEWPPS